jgi:predicted RNase H-like HicB family nuclease
MDSVRVIYEQDEDSWVATSPELPGWTAVGPSYDEAHRLAEEGVRFAQDRDDVELRHFVPASTARR